MRGRCGAHIGGHLAASGTASDTDPGHPVDDPDHDASGAPSGPDDPADAPDHSTGDPGPSQAPAEQPAGGPDDVSNSDDPDDAPDRSADDARQHPAGGTPGQPDRSTDADPDPDRAADAAHGDDGDSPSQRRSHTMRHPPTGRLRTTSLGSAPPADGS